ncbi:MAG: sigma-70 family RNA polymerase sigma factor [Prochlorococcaceae cyanobacterium MAG_34]|jgi:RNA polymerase primary sigma factor|uniref:sigma-70 family RNA polymerase sigma factor n=1 Tax=Cyanobium sp. TaxID=2164130 RepID=UPI00071543F0|nr:MAG: RNA polymerase subunit sigma [cyanobacterium BACL30 MAG-120619-bin27]MDP4681970.1 sigma-70 family RNA polymerase sigma factor [Cyanobium sp. MAG_255]MDP4707617.1 sigma-70 family RNA polymerase sigma factor [Cyanobium sp. MAG_237]MDP4738242.1 sigma-70 family RNA polymerase sigma factor [Cyanobium sp. MAG_216]MDP4808543.1 sigma-70 family RNA polymerase sigma factor [Cyanobium sp. MAG_160]MDP4830753.1 sigma-70 family RNA polymerase sigma factor [Cyanobium sp. MAG_185]MDP4882212.1 sigma-7
MTSSPTRVSESSRRRSSDPITWYLATIGREPLLTPAEEIELGNQVQTMMRLTEEGDREFSDLEKKLLRIGKRSKQRMMKANLRLVVSVAKKYQGKGLELLDLIQEGSLGLERAVEKFDPTRGYKFSTYAFWWIRQSMTRAIACQSRTIRLPVHLSERLTAIRKVSLELAHKLGAMPSRQEIAEAMAIPIEELDGLLRQSLTTSSLDAPVNGDEGRSFLGDLIADSSEEEPLDRVERGIHQEQLGRWLSHLSDQERQVLQLRFGLEGEERQTLAEIGRRLDVSRERVRQVELKALRKLRNLTRRTPTTL